MFKLTLIALLAASCVTALPNRKQQQYASLMPRVPVRAGFVAPARPDGRITGGVDAVQGQFPHQAGLVMDDMYFCGGILIATNWVMTAGHCTDDISKIVVTVGDQVRSDVSGLEQVQTAIGDSIILHEDYKRLTIKNDIGLVKLDADFELNENVALIELATSGAVAGEEVILSGWGRYSDDEPSSSDILKYVVVPLYDVSVCQGVYGEKVDGALQICIDTTGGKSSCNGDSGGPMTPMDGSVVYGITSFGASAGCEKEYPGVYTRVSGYLDWIATTMAK